MRLPVAHVDRLYLLFGLLGFCLMFGLTSTGLLPGQWRQRVAAWGGRRTDIYAPSYQVPKGDQLVMVYLGSASCAWSNAEGMPELIEQLKLNLRQEALRRGWSFEAVGVALDWNVANGLGHLKKFGSFDEVASGGNWSNGLALRYFAEHTSEAPSTPQVLVLHRKVIPPDFKNGPFTLVVENEEMLFRASGGVELKRWLRNGSRLPVGSEPVVVHGIDVSRENAAVVGGGSTLSQ